MYVREPLLVAERLGVTRRPSEPDLGNTSEGNVLG